MRLATPLVTIFCCSRAAALTLPDPSAYTLKALPAGKAAVLLMQWSRAADGMRSQGFQPSTEAIGERALKLKQVAADLPKLIPRAKTLGLVEQGKMKLEQAEKADAATRLARTTTYAAISAGKGSAIAFVSEWDDHVSIDATAVNPGYLIASEEAELALLEHVASNALQGGAAEVRVSSCFQVDGDAFYEAAGFSPAEGVVVEAAVDPYTARPSWLDGATDGRVWLRR